MNTKCDVCLQDNKNNLTYVDVCGVVELFCNDCMQYELGVKVGA
jgi:hypothetical protein